MAECPSCQGRKGPFTCFVNRGDAGCSVEQRPCSRCNGTGAVSDYEAKLYAEGRKVRAARIARDMSIYEAAKLLNCSSAEYSDIEQGRAPAFHDTVIARLNGTWQPPTGETGRE